MKAQGQGQTVEELPAPVEARVEAWCDTSEDMQAVMALLARLNRQDRQ